MRYSSQIFNIQFIKLDFDFILGLFIVFRFARAQYFSYLCTANISKQVVKSIEALPLRQFSRKQEQCTLALLYIAISKVQCSVTTRNSKVLCQLVLVMMMYQLADDIFHHYEIRQSMKKQDFFFSILIFIFFEFFQAYSALGNKIISLSLL